ncbi:hypothetical protein BDZ94DRAFT_1315387 [Collybia nuda]|uniref:DUF6534 domain-containing protein n=1 Tax=Collybia nuda TaxID=64659 RepID=A0A9P5XUY4_9AGAR|nr:hypothetical protein BDZ94DRAFT_1315387 [Collybia nuda]
MALPVPPPIITVGVGIYYATCFIGFTVATTLFGISTLQCYLYFRNHPKDTISVKSTVATLWLLDTISTTMVAHALYTYYVLNLGKVISDIFIPWSFAIENGCFLNGRGVFLVRRKISKSVQLLHVSDLERRNKILACGIMSLAISSFGNGLYVTARLLQYGKLSVMTEPKILVPKGFVQGAAAACDIIITLALVFYLKKRKLTNSTLSTEDVLEKLVTYAVYRGILTAITQTAFLTLVNTSYYFLLESALYYVIIQYMTFSLRTYWLPFHQIVGKRAFIRATSLLAIHSSVPVYVNSVVASLNLRKAAAGREGDSIPFPAGGLQFSTTQSQASSGTIRARFDRDRNTDHTANHHMLWVANCYQNMF